MRLPRWMWKAKGKDLTWLGLLLKVERGRFLFFFHEPDFLLRWRMRRSLSSKAPSRSFFEAAVS